MWNSNVKKQISCLHMWKHLKMWISHVVIFSHVLKKSITCGNVHMWHFLFTCYIFRSQRKTFNSLNEKIRFFSFYRWKDKFHIYILFTCENSRSQMLMNENVEFKCENVKVSHENNLLKVKKKWISRLHMWKHLKM